MKFDRKGLKHSINQIGVVTTIGGIGQGFLVGGTFPAAASMTLIGIVLILIGNLTKP